MSRPAQPHSKAPELDAQHAAEKKARTKKSHGFLKLKVFFDGGPSELVVQVSVIHPLSFAQQCYAGAIRLHAT